MASPQTGLFALGTASHAYLELDVVAGADPAFGRRRGRLPPRAADDDRRGQPRRRLPPGALGVGRARCVASRCPRLRGCRRRARWGDASGHAARRRRVVERRVLRRRVRPVAGGRDVARRVGGADTRARRLAVSPRPRPHGVHRRDGEPDAGRGLGGGRRPGRRGRRGRVDPAAPAVGARCDRLGGEVGRRPGGHHRPAEGR